MGKMIEIHYGDLFDSRADALVLPSSRSGTITGWTDSKLKLHGLPGPTRRKELGDIELIEMEDHPLTQFVVWAASVADDSSSVRAIEQIGKRLAVIAFQQPRIHIIGSPLLGSGAGGLSERDSATALVSGFLNGPDSNATLRLHVMKQTLKTELEVIFSAHLAGRRTAFISYGGPDEGFATRLNRALKDRGIKTYFFPDDALPGQKLHRLMHDGVNRNDRVILICSANSLNRNGVQNEIEHVLEREAREGGSQVLLPVRLDDFVLTDWTPARPDIASQIRTRVIADFTNVSDPLRFNEMVERLVRALQQ